jgi:hypothetical protein
MALGCGCSRYRIAPETKGADFSQSNVLPLGMTDSRMDFVLCFRLGGEKRQTDAKRHERSKLDHLIATESGWHRWISACAATGERQTRPL